MECAACFTIHDVALQTILPGCHAMLRAYTDSTGVEWRVWDVFPSAGTSDVQAEVLSGSLQHTAFANGWLCFESEREKRRLAPIPAGWELHDPTYLDQLRLQATLVLTRMQRRQQGMAWAPIADGSVVDSQR